MRRKAQIQQSEAGAQVIVIECELSIGNLPEKQAAIAGSALTPSYRLPSTLAQPKMCRLSVGSC
jgi:hypothetical protein